MIVYLACALISYLGLLIGNALAFVSPDEIEQYNGFVGYARHVCVVLALVLAFYINQHIFLALILLGLYMFFIDNTQATAVVLGGIFGMTFRNDIFGPLLGVIFLYFVFYGLFMTKRYMKRTKNVQDALKGRRWEIVKKALLSHVSFLVVAAILVVTI